MSNTVEVEVIATSLGLQRPHVPPGIAQHSKMEGKTRTEWQWGFQEML